MARACMGGGRGKPPPSCWNVLKRGKEKNCWTVTQSAHRPVFFVVDTGVIGLHLALLVVPREGQCIDSGAVKDKNTHDVTGHCCSAAVLLIARWQWAAVK